jgi:hypothetical protein
MTQIVETTKPLTDEERRQVEAYAESLIAKRSASQRVHRMNTDGLIGLCEGMGGDKSDKELIREGWEDVVAKLDR